jgi:triosephosphate isomerase (TIM)
MATSTRKPIIAGNWKMNKTHTEGAELITEILHAIGKQTEVTAVVCPPFTSLESAARLLEGSTVQLGAQNLYPKADGAYTGEVSPQMLRALFCNYVILGHSERREYFAESDAFINQKVRAALDNSLKPILCIGETLEQREAGTTFEVVGSQLKGALEGVGPEHAENLVIAYEPVWAIGTGRTATPQMAQEVHAFIRGQLAVLLSETAANRVRILYGGSMKPENAVELLREPDIDGGLIGGAALKAKSFHDLIQAATPAV